MENALPRTLNDRYRLDAIIGEGGMGVVYRGVDLAIGRSIAVKIIGAESGSTEVSRRFTREVRNTARVKHPNIVTLFDVGETGGAPFLVMELLGGESAQDVQKREGRLTLPRALAIARQACSALHAAHRAGIVHRDVKPGNLMLENRDGKEHVTVLDFGIAKSAEQTSELTGQGTILGTVEYMSPEQIACDPIDGRSDQYSLAATLVRLIAGEPLFPEATNAVSLVHYQMTKRPAALGERGALGISEEVDAAITRALEKSPDDRFATMAEFAIALLGHPESDRGRGDVHAKKNHDEEAATVRRPELGAATVEEPKPKP